MTQPVYPEVAGGSLVGRRAGPYELVEEIGRGGMGVVYRGSRVDGQLERQVAIKVVRAGVDAGASLERFRRERQILAGLSHPNIATLLDAAATDDGLPCFIMELVAGEPIDRWCDRAHLDLGERLALLRRVCLAVHHAHQRLVIHRDIKPANVLVTAEGVPKLLDFGIAKLLAPEGGTVTPETAPDARAMTLEYASPEQVRGEPLTTATDVYSLGVLAYRLVAGCGPYRSTGESLPELVAAICDQEPAPPSAAAPPLRRRAVRGDVDTIVLRALRKEPAQRYESAKALADDIGRFLAGEPVLAHRAGLAYRVGKKLRRHPLASAIAAAAVVIAIAGTVVSLETRRQAALRERLAQELGGEVERMEWIMRTAYHLPVHDTSREKAMVRERMRSVERRMRELGAAAEGAGHYALGRGHLGLAEWDAARAELDRAWQSGYRRPEAAYALGLALSYSYWREKAAADRMATPQARAATLAAGVTRYRDPALALLRQAAATGTAPEYLSGLIARLEGRYEEAVRWARAAVEAVPWLHEALELEGDAWTDLGVQRRDAGDAASEAEAAAAAERAYREAVRLAPSDARAHMRLLYQAKLRMVRKVHVTGEDPGADWRQVEEEAAAALAADAAYPDTYWHLAEAGWIRAEWAMGRGEDPLPALERAIDTAHDGLEAAPPQVGTLAALGTALSLRARHRGGHGQDPRPDFEAAMEAFRRGLSVEPENLTVIVNMGNAARVLAEHEMTHGEDPEPALREAGNCFRKAVEIVPEAANFHNNLGIVHNDLGTWRFAHGEEARVDLEEAVRCHERALALAPSHGFAANNLGNDHQQLALLAMAVGDDPQPSFRAAEEAFRLAIRSNPSNGVPYVNLIALYSSRADHARRGGRDPAGELPPAEASFAEAVRLNPEQVESYTSLAGLHLVLAESALDGGRSPLPSVARARELLPLALAIDASSAEARRLGGRAATLEAQWLVAAGRPAGAPLAEAARELERAAAINATDAAICRDLGELHRVRAAAFLGGPAPDRAAARAAVAAGLAAIERALAVNPALADAAATRSALNELAARVPQG